MKTKTTTAHIKDVSPNEGIIISYPSTFDTLDLDNDRVRKGAFSRTINARGPNGNNSIKVLFNHDPFSLVGKPTHLTEDDTGLLATTKISNTNLGRDTLTLLQDQVLTEHSIGYDIIQSNKQDDGTHDLTELKLWEYSFVTWGANPQTPVLSIKTALDLKTRITKLQKHLRDATFTTDEIPEALQATLQNWEAQLKNTLLIPLNDPEAIRNAITELKSLLPPDPAPVTPVEQDSTIRPQDPTNESHSSAVQAISNFAKGLTEEAQTEKLLQEFMEELGVWN